jgi:hypothetical protein
MVFSPAVLAGGAKVDYGRKILFVFSTAMITIDALQNQANSR